MPLFLLGLALGGISGGVTYGLTADSGVAGIVGVIAAVLTWFGLATVIFGDD
ncbi:hypothetical protein PV735_05420 [Streptomyces turgidiscabies]|uniref:Uncharacterized protein n=1 Tax=Streptomyces turgidiscabies (strain Car8) TaxID=698760 RepID=L7EYT5_STRT8|nr:hypothetical protein [Streptomyces turgidiscabies]ELP64167.1 hypothetical protein STRTUCAR8_05563 [Streptomyces turgidiscabies Car8]MDX3492129.1 hypothetical protein [Streptomyces turgidiscabies]